MQARLCRECQKSFIPLRSSNYYCQECNTEEKKRARATRQAREFIRALSPEERKRRFHKYNSSEAQILARIKHSTIPCVRCGISYRRSDIPVAKRSTYVCRQCTSLEKRTTTCKWCNKEFLLNKTTHHPTSECSDCRGANSKLARELGVSRERVRQLVKLEMSRGAKDRSEALERVREKRL